MAGRRLDAEERALWARVIATVRALEPAPAVEPPPPAPPAPEPAPQPARKRADVTKPPNPPAAKPLSRPTIGETLDGSWDRKLGRGTVVPDFAVDLHGHSLDSAHALLDASLNRAVSSGARIVLLITGKPPRVDTRGERSGRGAIRAAVGDWLSASRYARHIAAIRNAHPRHGGSGALYIVLKRARDIA